MKKFSKYKNNLWRSKIIIRKFLKHIHEDFSRVKFLKEYADRIGIIIASFHQNYILVFFYDRKYVKDGTIFSSSKNEITNIPFYAYNCAWLPMVREKLFKRALNEEYNRFLQNIQLKEEEKK